MPGVRRVVPAASSRRCRASTLAGPRRVGPLRRALPTSHPGPPTTPRSPTRPTGRSAGAMPLILLDAARRPCLRGATACVGRCCLRSTCRSCSPSPTPTPSLGPDEAVMERRLRAAAGAGVLLVIAGAGQLPACPGGSCPGCSPYHVLDFVAAASLGTRSRPTSDTATDAAVPRGSRRASLDAGLRSQAAHPGPTNAPHLTPSVARSIPNSLDAVVERDLAADELPRRSRSALGPVVVLGERRPVLVRLVVLVHGAAASCTRSWSSRPEGLDDGAGDGRRRVLGRSRSPSPAGLPTGGVGRAFAGAPWLTPGAGIRLGEDRSRCAGRDSMSASYCGRLVER